MTTPQRRATPPWDDRNLLNPTKIVKYYFAGVGAPQHPLPHRQTQKTVIGQMRRRALRYITFGASALRRVLQAGYTPPWRPIPV